MRGIICVLSLLFLICESRAESLNKEQYVQDDIKKADYIDVFRRPATSWSGGDIKVSVGGSCVSGGSGNQYIVRNAISKPIKIVICKREVRSGSYTRSFIEKSIPLSGIESIGCDFENGSQNEYRVVWADIDAGYAPKNILNASESLVIEESINAIGISNKNRKKQIRIEFVTPAGQHRSVTLDPRGGSNDVVFTTKGAQVLSAEYVFQYDTAFQYCTTGTEAPD